MVETLIHVLLHSLMSALWQAGLATCVCVLRCPSLTGNLAECGLAMCKCVAVLS